MPWYEPCSRYGYSKFYSNPQLRQDQWVVSDDYIQSLVRAFRQAYANTFGPDYEDGDSNLLDLLAENCISSTAAAAGLGQQVAKQDLANKQDAHPLSLAPGGAIGPTPSTGLAEHMATVYATTNPVGQPGSNVVMPAPSTVSFGSPGAAAGDGSGSPMGILSPSTGTSGSIPWWLIIAAAVGGYLLLKQK